jgi:hypothetical protein
MVYNIIQCMQWTFPNKDVSNIYSLKFWHQFDYLMHSLFQKCSETLNIISWKNPKGHLYNIYVLLKIIFINLTCNHFVYWHTIIHYNYNDVNKIKTQSFSMESFKHSFLEAQLWKDWGTKCNHLCCGVHSHMVTMQ